MRSILRMRPPFAARLDAPGPDWVLLDLDRGHPDAAFDAAMRRLRSASHPPRILVRVGPDGPERAALGDVMAQAPDGIWLADAEGRASVAGLGAELAVAEARHDLPDGSTRIVASVESARGALLLGELPGASPRLVGLAWHAGFLRRDLGLPADGAAPEEPLRHVRATLVLAARAGGIAAIDTPHGGSGHFAEAAAAAARDGYATKLARTTEELAVIARAFGA